MKKTGLVIIVIFIISVVCMITACQTESTDRSSANNTSDSKKEFYTTDSSITTEAPTVSELPSETAHEITRSDLMELIWWEDELADVGKVIYPGFKLDCEIKDGEHYRVFRSEEKGIEIWEKVYEAESGFPISRGQIILRNSEKSKEYIVYASIGNRYDKNTFSRDEKKVFFQDLTNDGREELIINIPDRDMEVHKNYVYVFDSQNFEEILFPDGDQLRDRVGEEIKVDIKDLKDGRVTADVTVGGQTYEAYANVYKEWNAEDMEYAIASSYGGYYVGDTGVYYRAEIYIYHKDYDYSVNNGFIPVDIPLVYNPELNAFEAVEGKYVVNNLR